MENKYDTNNVDFVNYLFDDHLLVGEEVVARVDVRVEEEMELVDKGVTVGSGDALPTQTWLYKASAIAFRLLKSGAIQ